MREKRSMVKKQRESSKNNFNFRRNSIVALLFCATTIRFKFQRLFCSTINFHSVKCIHRQTTRQHRTHTFTATRMCSLQSNVSTKNEFHFQDFLRIGRLNSIEMYRLSTLTFSVTRESLIVGQYRKQMSTKRKMALSNN